MKLRRPADRSHGVPRGIAVLSSGPANRDSYGGPGSGGDGTAEPFNKNPPRITSGGNG